MRRSYKWIGSALALGVIVAVGALLASSETADARPKCNCPAVVPTPEGPCVLISCSGSNCTYQCP